MNPHGEIPVRTEQDVVLARQAVRQAAVACGLRLVDQTKLVTAASELARNAVVYGGGGTMSWHVVRDGMRAGIRLEFVDQGPGIADIAQALTDGWTSGTGMGLGLSGSRRLVDAFEIDSAPRARHAGGDHQMGVGFIGQATRVIPVEEATRVGQVRREARALAACAGFGELDAGRVTLAATEVATNVLRHGGGGRVLLSLVQGRTGPGVEVCAIDRGPGFSLERCLPDGYTTGAGSPGQGLGAIRRQAQVFDVWSDAGGAVVLARIYPERSRDEDLDYGALRVPLGRETVCGDAWFLGRDGARVVVALVDGLGHGVQAGEAAAAGIEAVAEAPELAPDLQLGRMHARMAGSRGGAVAVACHEPEAGLVQFSGVGNIAASVHEAGLPARGLPSHPGIVGGQYRRAPGFSLPVAPGALLLLHSDGLQSRWNLARYEGLAFRHPALVLAVLLRDFDRGRDDTGAIAVRLGGRA